jgi:hypothetical protein
MNHYSSETLADGRGKVKDKAGNVVATTYGEEATRIANLLAAALNAQPAEPDTEVDE